MSANTLTTRWGITGYDNATDATVWTYSAHSESGAISLAKTMQKIGCTILEKPKLQVNGLWTFNFTSPLNRREFALPN